MIVSKSIRNKYDELIAYVPVLRKLVREELEPYCENRGFGFHDRIKTVESVAEKLESGRLASWQELDDLYAGTIVVPSLRDESGVLSELEKRFVRIRFRSRSTVKTAPDVFRFDSPRFIGRLRPAVERQGAPVEAVAFEIQVRTAFEDAWSFTTHSITYKSDRNDWRRARLAALLRAAVEQIDLTIAGFERTSEEVLPGVWEESEVKRDLLSRLVAMFNSGKFPSELRPAAWTRFVDNLFDLCLSEARRRGSARQCREVAEAAIAALEGWASTSPPEQIPRSLSLFQTAFGVLSQKGILKKGVKFSLFGAEDVFDVFPEARGVAGSEV
jgi:ppGpp synthetase/RelA/SpoT-type nucleotidyltranferase